MNSRFKKKNGGRGEESGGRNRSFFKSEGKLICAKVCFPTVGLVKYILSVPAFLLFLAWHC